MGYETVTPYDFGIGDAIRRGAEVIKRGVNSLPDTNYDPSGMTPVTISTAPAGKTDEVASEKVFDGKIVKAGEPRMSLRDKYKGDFYAALGDPSITDEQFKAVIKEAPHIGARFDEKTGRRIIDKSLEKPYEEYLPKNRPRNRAEAEVYEATKRGDYYGGIGRGEDNLKEPVNIMKLVAQIGKRKNIDGTEEVDYEAGYNALAKSHPDILIKAGMPLPKPIDILEQARAAIAVNPKNRGEVIKRLKEKGIPTDSL